ncbi:MAG TPA: O-antigen ligase family protein [Pseudomonadales bacterium]
MRARLHAWLSERALPVGLLLFLSGFFIAHYDTFFRNAVYATVLLPALLCACLDPRAWMRTIARTPMAWWLILFCVYLNVSPRWNATPTEHDPYLKYSAYIVLFFYAVCVVARQPARLWTVLRMAGVLAAVSACYSFWYVGLDADSLRGGRFHAAAIEHPLLSGNVYGVFLVMWLAEQRQCDHWPRWAAALCALPVFILVLLTQARSPLLGTGFALLLVALSFPAVYRRWVMYACGAGALGLLVFWQPLLMRGLSQRPDIWATVLDQALVHPWLGHGLGSEPVFVRRHSTLFDAHNVPLAVFFYGGAVGLLLWLGVLASAGRALWQQRHHALGLLAAVMLAYGVTTTFFEAGYFISRPKENWFYLWWPLALACAVAAQSIRSTRG